MIIRPEKPNDFEAVMKLTYEAFLTCNYAGRLRVDEHYLIKLLQNSSFVINELSYVAEDEGEIIGHILYTKSEVVCSNGARKETITFGPLSILPSRQKQGVGATLVRYTMNKAREIGFGAVLITGVAEYYPKLGFKRGCDFGLTLEDGTAEDYFMAYELVEGYLTGGGVLRFLPPEFEHSEKDTYEFSKFHKKQMTKWYKGQLKLRPLFDSDIVLMEEWLQEPHVAKWYLHPNHWLRELHERWGEFSFLTHFIVEYEGEPIGFCQYYDAYFAVKYEVWSNNAHVGKAKGEVYSIDYLIGCADYLRRGFGKEMIAIMLDMLREIGAKKVIVDPEKENVASNKALEASGFIWNGNEYNLDI